MAAFHVHILDVTPKVGKIVWDFVLGCVPSNTLEIEYRQDNNTCTAQHSGYRQAQNHRAISVCLHNRLCFSQEPPLRPVPGNRSRPCGGSVIARIITDVSSTSPLILGYHSIVQTLGRADQLWQSQPPRNPALMQHNSSNRFATNDGTFHDICNSNTGY